MRRLSLALLVACGTSAEATNGATDHDAATSVDAEVEASERVDAGGAEAGAVSSWARYSIPAGGHGATIDKGGAGNPLGGLLNGVSGRDYLFAFDRSAMYVITEPVEPPDQLDWNKLPGISDCGTVDLAADGAMFGWRWRLDRTPKVLEISAYANDAGKHLTPPAPMVSLDTDDLASMTALRYRLWMDGALYRFAVSGVMRGRAIDVTQELARRCATTAPSSLMLQWAAGFYFGGTSTAPSLITGRIFER